MTDIFLYQGEASSNDIRLRDPTTSGGSGTATPDVLVFSYFSQPFFSTSYKSYEQPSPLFEVELPSSFNPPTSSSLVFSTFNQPLVVTTYRNEHPSVYFAPFVQTTPAVIIGGDFADFDLVQSKKTIQTGFTGFVFIPPVQNFIFSSFSQPKVQSVIQEGQVTFNGSLGPAITPPWFVFSEYSQPRFKNYPAHGQDSVFFRILRPDAATPSAMGVFTQYSQPYFSKYPSSQQPSTFFELLSFAGTQTPADMGIFLPFSQPYFYKYPAYQQPDTFFEILPPPVVITTPVFTGFNDFGVPVYKKIIIDNQSFVFTPYIQPYVFTPFDQPGSVKGIKEGQIPFEIGFLGPAQTPLWFVFSKFPEVLTNKVQLLSFSNTPQPQFIQTFVFSAFDQPVITRLLREGGVSFEILTPSQATATPTSLVFAQFLEPVRTSTVNWLIDGVASIHFEPVFIPPVITDEPHFLPFLTTMGKLKSF